MFYINLNSENKVWHAYKGKQNKSAMLKSTSLDKLIWASIKFHTMRQSQRTQHQTLFTKKYKSTKHNYVTHTL